MSDSFDAIVVGAGFGGLGCALRLAERGRKPLLLETLNYPGGCASTYSRAGFKFESGATLFSGLDKTQFFGQWIAKHQIPLEIEKLDPVVDFRSPTVDFPVPASREAFVEAWCSQPGAPAEKLRRFFRYQERIADALWSVLDDPALLPPFGWRALISHALRLPRYLPLLRFLGRPALSVLRAYGLEDYAPLRTYLNGLCQITVQCGVEEAESAFALSTMDYYFRGTGHVRGGIGSLAEGLVEAIRRAGGEVRLSTRAKKIERGANGNWTVETRRGSFDAPALALNLLPQNAGELLGKNNRTSERLSSEVAGGWGACMLYLVAREPEGPGVIDEKAHHVEIVQDPNAPHPGDDNHADNGSAMVLNRNGTTGTRYSHGYAVRALPSDKWQLIFVFCDSPQATDGFVTSSDVRLCVYDGDTRYVTSTDDDVFVLED
ncbi:MAG: FAD-dependent oxidoreductase, partial [Planctomycetota bacterium]